MSIILQFPLEKVQRRSLGLPDKSQNAEIIVFEGIRYEKHSDKLPTVKQKKIKRKRFFSPTYYVD